MSACNLQNFRYHLEQIYPKWLESKPVWNGAKITKVVGLPTNLAVEPNSKGHTLRSLINEVVGINTEGR